MRRRILLFLVAISMLFPISVYASASLGNVVAKSKDINITMFGSLKTFPHFIENADFNDNNTPIDFILDENGFMEDHNIRNELRIGWAAKGENWDFLIILESDINLNKANVDRGADNTAPKDAGMTGEDFALEKLNFGYNFGSFKINTGWNTKFLDIRTGGILYGDDHPYIGFTGKFGSTPWEALYIIVQDETDSSGGFRDGDTLDWRVYTFRAGIDVGGYTIAPMYAFSDNEDHGADVHYLGVEGYGKIGMFTPRFEFVYAHGEQDAAGGSENDIGAYGLYGSIEAHISKACNVYFGGYYLSGDDDPTDDDVEAYNCIGAATRYSSTFGMENAFIYRFVPALGTHLYSNNFNTLGSTPGYGGISNSSKSDAPGLVMLGVGARGALNEKLSYKAQAMYFAFAEEANLTNVVNPGQEVDDEVGFELDLQLTYKFNNHFSIGNVLSAFFPGDGVTDRLGEDYDETGFINTIELIWKF